MRNPRRWRPPGDVGRYHASEHPLRTNALLTANPEIERPTHSQIRTMWETLDLQQAVAFHPDVSTYLVAVRSTNVNGGALLYCFRIGEGSWFDWFAARNRLPEIFYAFSNLPTVSNAAPELLADATDPEVSQKCGMPFLFKGELTATLVSGGAYDKFAGTACEAKALAKDFCSVVFANRYDDVEIYSTCKPWSSWFF